MNEGVTIHVCDMNELVAKLAILSYTVNFGQIGLKFLTRICQQNRSSHQGEIQINPAVKQYLVSRNI